MSLSVHLRSYQNMKDPTERLMKLMLGTDHISCLANWLPPSQVVSDCMSFHTLYWNLNDDYGVWQRFLINTPSLPLLRLSFVHYFTNTIKLFSITFSAFWLLKTSCLKFQKQPTIPEKSGSASFSVILRSAIYFIHLSLVMVNLSIHDCLNESPLFDVRKQFILDLDHTPEMPS